MKIKKEDIRKIINILEKAENELKEGEFFEFDRKINKIKVSNFEVPNKWSLDKTNDPKYHKMIYEWIITNAEDGHKYGKDWKLNYPSEYCCHYDLDGGKYFAGYNVHQSSHVRITWEQFETYIFNKDK